MFKKLKFKNILLSKRNDHFYAVIYWVLSASSNFPKVDIKLHSTPLL